MPDAASPRDHAHPLHLRWRLVALVAVGGVVGTALREAVTLVVPHPLGLPVVILGINLVGAFGLGVLLEALVRRGRDEGGRRTVRLLVGTGVAGGFTTYSTLAVDAAQLLTGGHAALGIGYGVATVCLGALATFAGIALAVAVRGRR